jgi:ribosomal protein S18 acetylase RimI-like enzyme
VASEPLALRPTIDRPWLERAAVTDPIAHALALWDLDHYPDRIRFVSAVRGEETVGYLLVWLGHPTTPIVHWFGPSEDAPALAEGLPPRPLVAIAPEEVALDIARARGPVTRHALLLYVVERGSARTVIDAPAGVRRLNRSDRPALVALASRRGDMVVSEYSHIDPEQEAIWGSFEGGRLRAVARAVVRLPALWILGGVYVDPSARGRGLGVAVVGAALEAGVREGATAALYVRADRSAARSVYERAGFQLRGQRVWLDAGAGLEP